MNGEVIDPVDNDLWEAVDEALDASTNLKGRHSQRKANVNASSSQMDASPDHVPIILNDDENVEDDYGYSHSTHNSERNDEYRARDNILNLYVIFESDLHVSLLVCLCPLPRFADCRVKILQFYNLQVCF